MSALQVRRGRFGVLQSLVPPGYSEVIGAMGPLAHWRWTSLATVEDSIGTLHGTFAGTGQTLVDGLPVDSDQAVNFPGTATATIPHAASLVLPAVSLLVWFRMNAFPLDTERFILVAKDLTGNNAGDTAIVCEDDGQLTVQMNAGVGSLQLPTLPLLEIGQTYCLVFRANNTGFDAYLNGAYLGKSTAYTGAWTVNTRQIEIATCIAYPLSANPANFVIDEMALFSRVITEAEVITLSQSDSPPIASDDLAVLTESATTVIDVVANDTFLGAKADLTVTIVSDSEVTTAGHAVSVDGNNDISFVAGAVAAEEVVNFTYKIEDALGESNVANVEVTVQDSAFVPTANANCFIISGADTRVVASMAALETEVNAAPPGRQILVAPGAYAAGGLIFTVQGTAANPVVIRPRDGPGTVTINNPGWTISNAAARLAIYGIYFSGGTLRMNGDHNRVTRCQFRQFQTAMALDTSRDGRVDHCDFSGMLDNANPRYCIQIDPNGFDNGTNVRNLIDYCYFHDINTDTPPPGAELIRMFNQTQNIDLTIDVCSVDHCLFRNIDIAGENEIISVKTGGFTVKFTTFENLTGSWLALRQCNNAVVRSCWFENASSTDLNGCLAIKGNDHLIIGNRVVGGHNISCWAGNCTIEENIAGTAPTPPHPRARDCRFVGNRLDTGRIQIGAHTGITPADPALDNNVALTGGGANIRDAGGNPYVIFDDTWETGTTFNADAEAFVSATKLLPAHVGLAAPDPLCPSGPQG